LLGILVTWWPVFALLYVPRLASVLTTTIARRTEGTLDHQIPDELPMTAGEWLASRLTTLGYPISTIVTDQQGDAYRPADKLIQLHDETHFKADPVYWATAAHELGHVRIRAKLPILGHLRTAAGWGARILVAVGVGLTFGRVLYALPKSGELALRCFALAVALQLFVLVDEALASLLAYRELRAHDAIDFVHLRAIRRVLAAAFATYLVTYAAYALLLRYWPLVEALAGDRGAHTRGLTWLGWTVAILASIGCVLAIIAHLARMFAPGETAESIEKLRGRSLLAWSVRTNAIVVLLWLAWDHRVDATYAWCAVLAFAASSRLWLALVHLPFLIPHVILTRFVNKLSGPGVDRTREYVRARQQGTYLVWAGNTRLERIAEQQIEHPSWPSRLMALAKLGYVPLLVALWLT
jgi:Zn-dependent membrane protease YugP